MRADFALLILLGIGTLISFSWLCLLGKRLGMRWYAALPIALLHTLYGVVTVKAFAFLETGFAEGSFDNMSLFGGVFFMPVAYWLGAKLFKRKVTDVFDAFSICMISTVMCARINCIIAGCCRGLLIPGTSGLHWPTREMEILFYIILLVWLGHRIINQQTNGTAYPIYMIAYGVFRFFVEFLRYSEHSFGIFHISHLWAMLSFCIGLSFYAELRSKKKVRR